MGLLEVKPEKNEEAKENDQVDVDLSSGCKGVALLQNDEHEKQIGESISGRGLQDRTSFPSRPDSVPTSA
ncbi:hypothetical protein FNV43_RR13264 [Rhamnella rubrinervis]|uniref:Uncharacterized protein n=1 Tax=Rhamnella rubrinervis TaxID=2594499 RepID=A0A8K0H0S2_9ROSA|nr:hypothetical protein FNV43_RR13264 [Rhamnella rubrinervis]